MPKVDTDLRDFLDYDTTRQLVFDGVLSGVQERFPIENEKYRLELGDLAYEGPEKHSLKQQKDAILRQQSLARNLKGTWRLIDKSTGQPLDAVRTSVARVPYLTNRGTYIMNGSEFTIGNQMRLKSGVFTRTKDSGDHEAHFNVLKGGPSFRLFMEPKTGIFRLNVGQSHLRLYPLMRAMGVSDSQLIKLWGPELHSANVRAVDRGESTLNKAFARLSSANARKEVGDKVGEVNFRKLFEGFQLDPDVTEQTLGTRYDKVTPEAMLRTVEKLINISKGTEDTDDRDSLAFQDTYSAEDFFKERVVRDAGRLSHRALWKATLRKNLSGIPPGLLTPQMESVLFKSGLGQALEEINSMDAVDQNLRVSRMGEGGIPSQEAIPLEARGVQPSHYLYIDAVRTPESGNVGVDSRVTINTRKGRDRKLYTKVVDPRTGKDVYLPPEQMIKAVVAFPGGIEAARKSGSRKVPAMSGGKIRMVSPKDVDFVGMNPQDMFNLGSNLVPGLGSIKAGRLLMGAKYISQALPLREPEAPYVQAEDPYRPGKSYENYVGAYAGVVRAIGSGVVTKVDDDGITVKDDTGKSSVYDLYNNFPMNRKSFLSSFPSVKKGDTVSKGQILATSNMTDKDGALALGKNLRTAYLPYRGLNFEDAIVVSESAANKLQSEHMYTEKMDLDNLLSADRGKFIGVFPGKFTRNQVSKLGDDGVVRKGQVLTDGDPVILAVQRRTPRGRGMLYRGHKKTFTDASVTWDHASPGVVTDVWRDKSGIKVAIKSFSPLEVGDKISGRYGDKAVVAKVIPDDQMPIAEDGRPVEVIANPLGIPSRVNPAQVIEAMLGKIAEKTGKPYRLKAFDKEDLLEFTIKEMEAHGIKDAEDLFDPESNRTIPKVFLGNRYYQKLHHTAESKSSGRGLGSYTAEGVPSQSPDSEDKPKRVGSGEMQALISHGAIANIRDIKTVRGQRNDEYWRAMTMGYPPPTPEIPMAYKKFLSLLQGAGINVKKKGNYVHLTAMTDKDVDQMSSGEIRSPKTVKWEDEYAKGVFGEKSMEPIEGGLFDRAVTGGHGGSRWSHVTLQQPMPQPAMEDPIRQLLGLTKKEFEGVISGRNQLGKFGTGPEAMHEALKRMNPITELVRLREELKATKSGMTRDTIIKKVKYLRTMQEQGTKPADLMVTKVPVIPPIFRPIAGTKDFTMVSGSNKLYINLMQSIENYGKLKGKVGEDILGNARLNVYNAFKAVTGLGDPVAIRQDVVQARGLLKEVFGGSSPKYGLFQRRLLGTPVDMAARAVISPNPALDMDQIGLPEDKAWQLYAPFVVRRIIRTAGNSPTARMEAIRMVSARTPKAKELLLDEMEKRPVLATRAPALHRYSIMAFKPVLSAGNTLEIPPAIVPGLNADFDGDTMNFHVTVSDKAVQEAKDRLLPSRNLRSPADFGTLWLPRQEFLQGLYLASTKRTGRRLLPVFNSEADVIAAYKRGELNIDDAVSVKERS